MRTDEFVKNVTQLGGPSDADRATEVTRTILENLGKRLKGGEAQNLADQLPQELSEPLTRHGAHEPLVDDVDDFLRRVAGQLGSGTGTDEASACARAVFATLAQSVSEGEIADVRAQLSTGFAPLFEPQR